MLILYLPSSERSETSQVLQRCQDSLPDTLSGLAASEKKQLRPVKQNVSVTQIQLNEIIKSMEHICWASPSFLSSC